MEPHAFWQEIHPPQSFPAAGPHQGFYPASLKDGRQLRLPIRPLSDGVHALASLIINQAAFEVVEVLAEQLAEQLAAENVEVIVGLPTLGLTLAAAVARKLGHSRYVPCGNSRKFWYRDELSVPISSITTPDQVKRLYLDPRMLPLIEGRRVALVDDVLSSGTSIVAGLTLLAQVGVEPVAIGAAMLQTRRFEEALDALDVRWKPRVRGVLQTPCLRRVANDAWI
ncbi:phosphoribosyltransferase [Rhizobium sp. FKY42]|uniref:phosphoribosyltransferase n=1 Tax=Rhizobium sp. FKY42 TaxID=2562310 RepID=UPI0010C04E1B|nr:phosphoribosyltransferase [Rhizobium sp. FKY42]